MAVSPLECKMKSFASLSGNYKASHLDLDWGNAIRSAPVWICGTEVKAELYEQPQDCPRVLAWLRAAPTLLPR